jgi:hypothetical protein
MANYATVIAVDSLTFFFVMDKCTRHDDANAI